MALTPLGAMLEDWRYARTGIYGTNQPSDGTKGEVLKAGRTAFGRGGTLNHLLPKHRHSRHGGASFAQQEHLVLPGGATRSHRDWDFHPQVPLCGPTRSHRPERVIQLVPAPDPTALKRTQRTSFGVATRGDPAMGQDSRGAVWEVESPPTVSRCSEGVRLAPGASVG